MKSIDLDGSAEQYRIHIVPEDFIKAFDTIHGQNPEAQILYLAYSSAITVSYQSALIASEGRDYVISVDTKSILDWKEIWTRARRPPVHSTCRCAPCSIQNPIMR